MRTFVQLRRLMDTNRDLARKIEGLEKKYDEQFTIVFEAIVNSSQRTKRAKLNFPGESASNLELMVMLSAPLTPPLLCTYPHAE